MYFEKSNEPKRSISKRVCPILYLISLPIHPLTCIYRIYNPTPNGLNQSAPPSPIAPKISPVLLLTSHLQNRKKRAKHTSAPNQIPSPCRAPIDPARIELPLRKEPPRGARVHEREVRVQDPFPAALDCGGGARGGGGGGKVGGPFFGDEARGAD